jgi:hypothetical protein
MKYIFSVFLVVLLSLPLFFSTDFAKKSKLLFSNVFSLEASSRSEKWEFPESFPLWRFISTTKSWKTMEDDFDEQEGSDEEQENEELEEDA